MQKKDGNGTRQVIFVLTLVALTWIAVASWMTQHAYRSEAEQLVVERQEDVGQRARSLAQSISQNLQTLGALPRLLADSAEVEAVKADLARGRRQSPALQALSRYLEQHRPMLNVDLLYVLDAKGECVAASNWRKTDSLLGHNFADRDYFRRPEAGLPGMQYAFGRITRLPGLFFSAPILADGRFLGVAVVKINIANLVHLVKDQERGFISDEHGVIILSNHPAMELAALPGARVMQLPPERRQEIYQRSEIPSLEMRAIEQVAGTPLFRMHGSEFPHLLSAAPVPGFPFTVHVTHEVAALPILKRERSTQLVLSSLLGVLIVIGVGFTAHYFRSIRRNNAELRASESRLRRLLVAIEQSPASVVITDADAAMQYVNPMFTTVTGYTPDEVLGKNPRMLASGQTPVAVYRDLWQTIARGVAWCGEFINRRKDGSIYWEEAHIAPVIDPASGKPTHYVAVKLDISARKQNEENLLLARKVFENTLEGIVITDAAANIIEINPAFCRITGYQREEVLGRNPRFLKSGRQDQEFYERMWQQLRSQGHWSGEMWNCNKAGELYAQLLTISALFDSAGRVTHYVGIAADITPLKQHEKQLEHIAHYDALTGIPNRVLLADRLKQAMASALRNRTLLAICYLDLDGFKEVNDEMGHAAGDRVLVEVTRRIRATIRGDDTVARLGGDEFVVLLSGLNDPAEAAVSLDRLLDALADPIFLEGRPFQLGASIGVSIFQHDSQLDSDTLLRHADQAMYVAKQSGKNRYHFYDAGNDQRMRAHHELLRRIAQGLRENEFVLYYQPKIDMRTKEVLGVEALIRWQHPERGLLMPGHFLDAAVGNALELELGEWVVAHALEQMDVWRCKENLLLPVSINISALHLQSRDFVWKLKRKILRYPELPANMLKIEVLETAALEDIEKAREVIDACHKFGVSFALDDFGTGYSSLAYLGGLPVDELKIDQSFVRSMLEDKGCHAIVQGVIALARAFGRGIVAEGVETGEIASALLGLGCEVAQGYHFARPMPPDEFPRWLEHWKASHGRA